MEVAQATVSGVGSASSGRRVLVGTNVVFATVLVVGLVAVLQLIAFKAPLRHDMTTSGVNSLSDATENLLRNLDQNVRLTSLYFETDREDADQPRYRQAVKDLIDLYEATNRSKIKAEWVNPLKDHERFQKLLGRLRDLPAFQDGVAAYQERIDYYKNGLDDKLRALIQQEMSQAAAARSSAIGGAAEAGPVARVELTLRQLEAALDAARKEVDALSSAANPQLAAAVSELRSLYPQLSRALKDIGKFGTDVASKTENLSASEREFLQGAGGRYAEVVADVEGETTKVQDLEPLKLDDLVSQLLPTANALLVDTDTDARVVDFNSVWPPLDQRGGARVPFDKRAFKGEEKLTAAVLRATHKEQTAVVFVRYGGPPLFMGGFMPGQPPAPYASMKLQLEDANFIVEEWDLKSTTTPPNIDPVPTRTIFVVLKPEPPQRGPMGQPSQEPPFGDVQREALLNVLGDKGRALFVAGWAPGMFPSMPSEYEYNEYLKKNWGISVNTSALLFEAISRAPGEFVVDPRNFFNMSDMTVSGHDIVSGPLARQIVLPWAAPLEIDESPPESVEIQTLITMPGREGIWGVKDITRYQQQFEQRDYLTKESGDLEGPFPLAAAATKGNAKIVVISSREFAQDDVAFAKAFGMTSQGFTIRSRNPGNVTLLINSLHWLNDNTEFMNIGRPIDANVLEIPDTRTVRAVQAFTIFVWPALALACGGIAWWIRRK